MDDRPESWLGLILFEKVGSTRNLTHARGRFCTCYVQ